MPRRIVDLSIAIDMDVPSDPPGMEVKIEYTSHAEGAPQMARFFEGLTTADLPDGEGWAVERVTLSTHNGTHMDAPWHFHSTTDHGARPAPAIDETPLDQCFQAGVKLDFRHFPDGYVATAADVEAELKRIGHELRPLDIVVVNTRAGEMFGKPEFIHAGCGLGREATLYLTERGVKVVGADAWSWDAPFSHTAKKWPRPAIRRSSGRVTRPDGRWPIWQMEKLTKLAALPPTGFEICCFPVKIKGASAGWSRVVAIFND